MSTQQQIDDPGQWRVGDDVRIEWPNGVVLTGKAGKAGRTLAIVLDENIHYDLAWMDDGRKVTVTRTVEPIPEPTVPWALVRRKDGAVSLVVPDGATLCDHKDADQVHGAPVAVSLPHWSDEVDGLRAGVQREVERMEHDLATRLNASGSHAVVAQDAVMRIVHNLRALLAEGGEA